MTCASGKSSSKAQHIAIICASPAIDGLVGIADDKEVVVEDGQMLQQLVLRLVGILKLIHQDVLVAAGIALSHCHVFFQQVGRPEQQIVEIHGVVHQQQLLVAAIDALHHFIAVVS